MSDDPQWEWNPGDYESAAAIGKAMEFAFGRWDLQKLDDLDPDECLFQCVVGRSARCNRPDHPTPTSDCTTGRPTPHITADADAGS